MSFLGLASAIKARWVANWTYTQTAYDNVSFNDVPGTAWARLAIRDGDARQLTMGQLTIDRHAGVVMIQIFTPLLQGIDRSRWLADKAASIFRKVDMNVSGEGKATFAVPYLIASEQSGDDWWQTTVVCPYYYDLQE